MLHPWAGLIFFAAVWNMYAMWAPQMRHTDVDKSGGKRSAITARIKMTRCRRPDGTTRGRSSVLGFFWSAVALLATGLVLWFPERIPWIFAF